MARANSLAYKMRKDYARNRILYLLLLPVIAYYMIFHYVPMVGIIVGFKNYSPRLGIFGSHWVGLKWFKQFFSSFYFERVMRNTLMISFQDIILGFPLPILLAIMFNEIHCTAFKRCAQTISYLPYFISTVVVCSMVKDLFALHGAVNSFMRVWGVEPKQYMNMASAFQPILVGSNIWQTTGWNSIIYLAALTAINSDLYEAAMIDGAGKLRQIWHVTLPGIRSTIAMLLILRLGSVMNVGFEKIILLANDMTIEKADVISTLVYRKGLIDNNFGYSTAVGLFNSLVNCMLLVLSNRISRTLNDSSIW